MTAVTVGAVLSDGLPEGAAAVRWTIGTATVTECRDHIDTGEWRAAVAFWGLDCSGVALTGDGWVCDLWHGDTEGDR